jgi:hypothetical protein
MRLTPPTERPRNTPPQTAGGTPKTKENTMSDTELGKLIAQKISLGRRVKAAEELLASPYGRTDAEIASAAKLATYEVPASYRSREIAAAIARAKAKRDKVAAIKAESRRQAIRKAVIAKYGDENSPAALDRRAAAIAASFLAAEG